MEAIDWKYVEGTQVYFIDDKGKSVSFFHHKDGRWLESAGGGFLDYRKVNELQEAWMRYVCDQQSDQQSDQQQMVVYEGIEAGALARGSFRKFLRQLKFRQENPAELTWIEDRGFLVSIFDIKCTPGLMKQIREWSP